MISKVYTRYTLEDDEDPSISILADVLPDHVNLRTNQGHEKFVFIHSRRDLAKKVLSLMQMALDLPV